VIIVGAGPVGLLTALRLGQAGISTLVLESHHTLLPTTRAMVYMPVVIPVLRELGILDVVLEHAFLNREGVTWRDLDGNALAHLPLSSSTPGEFGGVLLFGQSRMNTLILEELKKYPSVEVRFGLRCVGIEDLPSSSGVKVMMHQRNLVDEDLLFEADYVLAADGANSSVRRMMCIPFEGFSFQEWKMIGCDVSAVDGLLSRRRLTVSCRSFTTSSRRTASNL
jgi:2-polyprenyl-6-methoxyphenol hydroxylase-like FAD-dependent oxidoreductase